MLLGAPLLLGWAGPYVGDWLPAYETYPIRWAVGGDAVMLLSLFVLGGDFWDKIRGLFLYDARVSFEAASRRDSGNIE